MVCSNRHLRPRPACEIYNIIIDGSGPRELARSCCWRRCIIASRRRVGLRWALDRHNRRKGGWRIVAVTWTVLLDHRGAIVAHDTGSWGVEVDEWALSTILRVARQSEMVAMSW